MEAEGGQGSGAPRPLLIHRSQEHGLPPLSRVKCSDSEEGALLRPDTHRSAAAEEWAGKKSREADRQHNGARGRRNFVGQMWDGMAGQALEISGDTAKLRGRFGSRHWGWAPVHGMPGRNWSLGSIPTPMRRPKAPLAQRHGHVDSGLRPRKLLTSHGPPALSLLVIGQEPAVAARLALRSERVGPIRRSLGCSGCGRISPHNAIAASDIREIVVCLRDCSPWRMARHPPGSRLRALPASPWGAANHAHITEANRSVGEDL